MTESSRWWVDGVACAQVPTIDRGLAYGDGVFETMRVDDGCVRLLRRHLDRLQSGAARLGIVAPDRRTLEAAVADACRTHPGPAILKLIVTRGDGGRGYQPPADSATRWLLGSFPLSPWPDTIAVRWCETRLARQPALAGIKHLNRLEQVLARAEWRDTDRWQEGLMLDTEGNVVAATQANVFVVHDGVLRTPSLRHCGVAGIMRAMVLDGANDLGQRLQIGELTVDDVVGADECFLCNSVRGVVPVHALAEVAFRAPGPATARLRDWVTSHE